MRRSLAGWWLNWSSSSVLNDACKEFVTEPSIVSIGTASNLIRLQWRIGREAAEGRATRWHYRRLEGGVTTEGAKGSIMLASVANGRITGNKKEPVER